MKKHRATVAFVLLIFLVASLAWWLLDEKETVLRLSNGEKLVLRAVTVGTNSTYCYGNLLQKVGSKLPGPLGERLSAGTVGRAVYWGTPTATFWFLHEGSSSSYQFQLGAVDEDGLEIDPQFTTGYVSMDTERIGIYFYGGILPRRSPKLKLRVYPAATRATSNLLGEIQIKNPLFVRVQEWTAEPLPARRVLGENTFTLEELTLFPRSRCRIANGEWIETTVARLRIRGERPQVSTENWSFFGARHSDGSGAFSRAWFLNPFWLGPDLMELVGPWEIWPSERPVRIQVLLLSHRALPTNEVFLIRIVPVSASASWWIPVLQTSTPYGEIGLSARRPLRDPGSAFEFLLWSGDPRFYSYDDELVRGYFIGDGRDDKGRKLKIADGRSVTVEPDAVSVDLAIGFPAARKLEFVVKPTMALTNLPSTIWSR